MKKIPSEVRKELEGLAKDLPPCHYKNFNEGTLIRGKSLIDAGVNKTKGGYKIDPNEKYVTMEQKTVDHYKKLRKIWLEAKDEPQAWQKIKTYCAQIKHNVWKDKQNG